MYDHILLAVDHSEQSDRAVLAARDLAKLSGGTVQLLHVRERQVVVGKGGGSFDLEDNEEAQAIVDQHVAVLEQAGVPFTTNIIHSEVGHVGREIVEAAKEAAADIVVMGSHGRTSLGALIIGSNAYKVLHLADRPVLVVR